MGKTKFTVGQKVIVTRIAKSDERGWTNSWESPEMDKWVGKTCSVVEVCPHHDITLKRRGTSMTFGFPDFVLRPAKERKD